MNRFALAAAVALAVVSLISACLMATTDLTAAVAAYPGDTLMNASAPRHLSTWRATLRAWWASLRAPASPLRDLDERMLNDIGLTRAGTPSVDLIAATWDTWSRWGVRDLQVPDEAAGRIGIDGRVDPSASRHELPSTDDRAPGASLAIR